MHATVTRHVVSLSESEACGIISEELAKEGITIDRTDVDLVGEKLLDLDRGEAFEIFLDGYSTASRFGFEYVSVDDFQTFGGIIEKRFIHSQWQNLRALAENVRSVLAARGKVNAAVFYDPLVMEPRWFLLTTDVGAVRAFVRKAQAELLKSQVRDAVAWMKAAVVPGTRAAPVPASMYESAPDFPSGPTDAALRLGVFDDLGDPVALAAAHRQFAMSHLAAGNKEKALASLRAARRVLEDTEPIVDLGLRAHDLVRLAGQFLDAREKDEIRAVLKAGMAAADGMLARSKSASSDGLTPLETQVRCARTFDTLAHEYSSLVPQLAQVGDFATAVSTIDKARAAVDEVQKSCGLPGGAAGNYAGDGNNFVVRQQAELAKEFARAGKFDKARAQLESVSRRLSSISLPGPFADAQNSVAIGYALMGETSRATSHFDESEKTCQKDQSVYCLIALVGLAKAHDELGDKKRAAVYFERALANSKTVGPVGRMFERVHLEAARWYLANGFREKAVEAAKEEVRLGMQNEDEWYLWGKPVEAIVLLSRAGEKDAAAGFLQEMLVSLSGGCHEVSAAGWQLAAIGAGYDAAEIPCDESCRKLLGEIVQNAKEAGGRKPVLTSPAKP
ncbi:MAG: tetratricopeptide repeat protein [Deltaproteobacteria bacterium]|nr:tetratricopeptide repeat protein [Deltaproteobacteria bacterium]